MPSNQPIVLVRERDSDRYLPIWIGAVEASAIAFALQGVESPRPLTHDLAVSMLTALGWSLERVEITDLVEGVFYADLHLASAEGETRIISGRPSDSLALAVRVDAAVYVAEDVLEEASIEAPQEEEEEVEAFREFLDHVSPEDFADPGKES